MKKTALCLSLALLAGLASGCAPQPGGPAASSAQPLRLETLSLELSRTGEQERLQAVLRALPEALRAALADHGVEAGEVAVSVGASHAATAQALAEGGVDLAVLPASALAGSGSGAEPVLTPALPQPPVDSEDPADWAAAERRDGSGAAGGGMRLLILAGPSEYGARLAGRQETAGSLGWTELNNAAWAVSGGEEAGMVSLWLADRYTGMSLSSLSRVTAYETANQALEALADGTADLAVVAAGAEALWTGAEEGSLWRETAVVGVTERYYKTVVAVAPEHAMFSDAAFLAALRAALDDVCGSDEDAAAVLGGTAFTPVTASDLEPMGRLAAFE